MVFVYDIIDAVLAVVLEVFPICPIFSEGFLVIETLNHTHWCMLVCNGKGEQNKAAYKSHRLLFACEKGMNVSIKCFINQLVSLSCQDS